MKIASGLLGLVFVMAGVYLLFFTNNSRNGTETMGLALTSTAFEHNGMIPSQYTCDGPNISPPLTISNIPENTQSLVLIVDDPDVPKEVREDQMVDHWVLYGIPPTTTEIPEGTAPGGEGINTRGSEGYIGPCPPPEYEPTTHRYFFKLYALRGSINFVTAPTKGDVESAIQGMIIEQTELIGLYDRSS